VTPEAPPALSQAALFAFRAGFSGVSALALVQRGISICELRQQSV